MGVDTDTTFSTRVSLDCTERFDRIAKANGRSRTKHLRVVIEEYVAKSFKPETPKASG